MINWKENNYPFKKFTKELTQKWIDCGFTKKETREWLESGLQPSDVDFAKWLRDVKKVDAEWFFDYGDEERMREEYNKKIEILGQKKYNRQHGKFILEIVGKRTEGEKAISYLREVERALFYDIFPNDKKPWDEKLESRNKKLCLECYQPNSGYGYYRMGWCKPCNSKHFQKEFKNWTSGNQGIDKLIKKYQLEANNSDRILEWIPYDQFKNVKFLAQGGFGKAFKAEWTGSNITHWDVDNKKWGRFDPQLVVLKILHNSQDITTVFLQEVISHKLTDNGLVVHCYGISRDPITKNYVMVMQYIEDGDLRKFLENKRLSLEYKVYQLKSIIEGLEEIHYQGLIHRDLHPGNILNYERADLRIRCYITDLGLCCPANEEKKGKIFGVLPYVAPEVLCGQPYTQASDIYSFGIITYEILFGLPPYYNIPHDEYLALKVCEGLRPEFDNDIRIPQMYRDLITKCWDANPFKRPSLREIRGVLYSQLFWDAKDLEHYKYYVGENEKNTWCDQCNNHIRDEEDSWFSDRKRNIDFCSKGCCLKWIICKTGKKHYSCLLDFKNLPKPQNSREINEKFWSSYYDDIITKIPLVETQKVLEKLKIDDKRFSQSVEFNVDELNQINWEEIDNPDYQNIHPTFTPQLTNQWTNHSFTYPQTRDWINIGLQPTDSHFAAFLRDTKNLTPLQVLNHHDYQTLKAEFELQSQIEILPKK